MLVNFAQNLTVLAPDATGVTITTDPVAIGPNLNKCQMTMVTHGAFGVGSGPPTVSALAKIQGSNDGQTWFDTDLAITATSAGNQQDNGDFLFAFARLELFAQLGGTGDFVAWMGDIHCEFKST